MQRHCNISPRQVDNNNSTYHTYVLCAIDLCCSVCPSSGPSYGACFSSLGSHPRVFTVGTYVCLLYDMGARCSGGIFRSTPVFGTSTYGVPYVNCRTYEQRQPTAISLGKSTTTAHIHIQLHMSCAIGPSLSFKTSLHGSQRQCSFVGSHPMYRTNESMSAIARYSGDLFFQNGVPTVRKITSDDR